MRTFTMSVLLLAIVGIVASACTTATADRQSACDRAFAQAMAIDPASDTVNNVDGAIATCPSVEAWVDAAQRYPDAIDGQDPTAIANERCGSQQLATTPVCVELRGK